MNKYNHGVVHGGTAHRDDMLAVAIAWASDYAEWFVRREPYSQEMGDPKVLVMDVGRHYAPQYGKFDHHQLPRTAPADCATWMLCRHIGIHDDMYALFGWYRALGIIDSKGPTVFADSVGVSWEAISGLIGPFERLAAMWFEEHVGDDKPITIATAPWLFALGQHILLTLNGYRAFETKAPVACVETYVNGVLGIVASELTDAEIKNYLSVWTARRKTILGQAIGYSIVKNYREGATGLILYRYDDDKRIDFSRIAGMPDVDFVHATGFLASTKKMDVQRALELVGMSIVPAPNEVHC